MSLENQCLEFLNLVLRETYSEEDDQLIEKGGVPGSSSLISSGVAALLHQKSLISKLLSTKPANPDLLNSIIPRHLPDHLQQNVDQIDHSSLSSIFNMEAAARLVAENQLTNLEVVSGYIQSVRNMFEYELSDQGALKLRLLKYFARIFTDIVERFCPSYQLNQHESISLEQVLLNDIDVD